MKVDMNYSVVVFGGIGTLVETSALQYAAFNRAFANAGVDFRWSRADYIASLASTGGRNRLADLVASGDVHLSDAQMAQIHAEKTRVFNAMLADTVLPLRPGVAALLTRARDAGITVAWATTTSQANIDAVVGATNGALALGMFAMVGHNHLVTRQKPDPEIYTKIVARLAIDPATVLAIEDSPTGVQAAKAAQIYTVAFPGAMQIDNDFTAADRVVHNLDAVVPLIG
jgi:HAD superfamily hydrolase (TIGR01509 family)